MDYDKLIVALQAGNPHPKSAIGKAITVIETLQAENEKLRAELEQTRAEITRLKYYEDKCHDCPIVCAKTEIIKVHEELERVRAELEVQKTKCDRCRFYPGKED